jgi:cytidine kinase
MSVLIVGTTALDSIKTPTKENPRLLGGSASHAAVAASFFSPVKLIGGVGEDFPKKYIELYRRHKIDLAGPADLPGKTFHWSGEYEVNMNNRRTLLTELGVIETFTPKLPAAHQNVAVRPARQHRARAPASRARPDAQAEIRRGRHDGFVAEHRAADLLKLLKRMDGFVLNDSEAESIHEGGQHFRGAEKNPQARPEIRHHQKRFARLHPVRAERHFHLPGVSAAHGRGPDRRGRFIRRRHDGLSRHGEGSIDANIRRAMVYGSVTASFCCEGFGLTAPPRPSAPTSKNA